MSFQDMTARVMRSTRLNPEYFAESITYRTDDDDEWLFDAHCRHSERLHVDPDSAEESVIEVLEVEIDRESLPRAPKYGDRVYRVDDGYGYLYQHIGRSRPHSWKATFERRRMTAQGN
jgi:hypothetical protein